MASACPLCDGRIPDKVNVAGLDAFEFRCDRCGTFRMDGTAAVVLLNRSELRLKRYLLSGLTRRASDRGKPLFLTADEFDQLVRIAPAPMTLPEAVDRLLLAVHERAPDFQGVGSFDVHRDYPLIFVAGPAEAEWTEAETLQRRGFLAVHSKASGSPALYRITPRGWDRLDELRRVGSGSDQAFVAMSFNRELDEARDVGFKPALVATGYRPLILLDHEHNGLIDDLIVSEIRRSGLLVVDFTLHAKGAYFEAGFAMGLGLPVIRTCRESDWNELHFDVNHYNVISWTEPPELREKLERRIRATVPGRAPRTTK